MSERVIYSCVLLDNKSQKRIEKSIEEFYKYFL